MELKELLTGSHSAKMKDKVVKLVKNDAGAFETLLKYTLGKDEELARRAAWPLSYVAGNFKEVIIKNLKPVITELERFDRHIAIKRNLLRALRDIVVPEEDLGALLDACFNLVKNSEMPPAIRAFSMSVIDRNSKKYPELMEELALYIEPRLEFESKAFISRGKKIVAKSLKLKQ